jgi:hypothetical protein
MTYLVFCTFDLKSASARDYNNAYADLTKLGLKKVAKDNGGGDVVIPTTSAMGTFNGASAVAVAEHVRTQVRTAFAARRFSSEIFVVVGGDWAWASGTS